MSTYIHLWYRISRGWNAATSVLTSSSFYMYIGPKDLGFLENSRNPIYLKKILVTPPRTILSLKLTAKATQVQLVELLIPILKRRSRYQFLLALLEEKNYELSYQNNQCSYLNYLFQPFFHL